MGEKLFFPDLVWIYRYLMFTSFTQIVSPMFQLLRGGLLFLAAMICFDTHAKNKLITTIPFEMVGTYIVLTVRINNSSPLKMILDTGLRYTLVTELDTSETLDVMKGEMQQVQGLGDGRVLMAHASEGNTIQIAKFKMTRRTVFVFTDNFFSLSNQIGVKINGLLGVDFFRDHVVTINYISRKIRLYSPDGYVAPRAYSAMPMSLFRQKMYLQLSVLETDSARQNIKMLIDTGAELTAWFETLTNKSVRIPDKAIRAKIGEGFSGEINGVLARVNQLCIADFCVKNPIVAFPDSLAVGRVLAGDARDGTIGGQMLSRFNVIVDKTNLKFYFKPNANFNKPFVYNVSGIEVIKVVGLPLLPVVSAVWENSPGQIAGLLVGDIISEINGLPTFRMPITEVRHHLETASNHFLKLKIDRNGTFLEVEINRKAKI